MSGPLLRSAGRALKASVEPSADHAAGIPALMTPDRIGVASIARRVASAVGSGGGEMTFVGGRPVAVEGEAPEVEGDAPASAVTGCTGVGPVVRGLVRTGVAGTGGLPGLAA